MSARQCVILVGGLGTRLSALTAHTPKPLLEVGGHPFLEVLLREATRRTFDDIVLLAGYRSEVVAEYMAHSQIAERLNARITLSVEPKPLGTAGALKFALPLLRDEFLLLNGDTWFDFNWLDLYTFGVGHDYEAVLALRAAPAGKRYDTVLLDGATVRDFRARGDQSSHGLINGGVYYLRRSLVEAMEMPESLENGVLPPLCGAGRLGGRHYPGFFIDIGVPQTYADAQTLVPQQMRRPAVFFDRDGVLNVDPGYTHKPELLAWNKGAIEAVKLMNDRGAYVFVVTNQAGIAKGHFTEADALAFHAAMREQLAAHGAYIDDWRYCPFHPEGSVAKYRRDHPWRKPAPGMLLDLMRSWPVDRDRSFLVGDKMSDIEAAHAAGVAAYMYEGQNLSEMLSALASSGSSA